MTLCDVDHRLLYVEGPGESTCVPSIVVGYWTRFQTGGIPFLPGHSNELDERYSLDKLPIRILISPSSACVGDL